MLYSHAEAVRHAGPSQASQMELFARIVKVQGGTQKEGQNETVVVSTNGGIFARFFHKM